MKTNAKIVTCGAGTQKIFSTETGGRQTMIRFLSPLKKNEGSDVNTTPCQPGSTAKKFERRMSSVLRGQFWKHSYVNDWKMRQGFAARADAPNAGLIREKSEQNDRVPGSREKRMKHSLSADFRLNRRCRRNPTKR